MTPITVHQSNLSTSERRRQLEESAVRAMERYKSEFEAVRVKTAKLRAAREVREAEAPVKPPRGRAAKKAV